jgi:hypothetical protein
VNGFPLQMVDALIATIRYDLPCLAFLPSNATLHASIPVFPAIT